MEACLSKNPQKSYTKGKEPLKNHFKSYSSWSRSKLPSEKQNLEKRECEK